jgi:DNA-binding CsgD family transcriptional regulator
MGPMSSKSAGGNAVSYQAEAQVLQSAVAAVGLDFFVVAREHGRSWQAHASSSCPAGLFDLYFKNEVANHDPVRQQATVRRGLISWRTSLEGDIATGAPSAFRLWATSNSIRTGYSASFIGTGYRCDIISVLSSAVVELDKEPARNLLSAISRFWHSLVEYEQVSEQADQVRLTPRETSVLQWMKEGKSYGDIATITGLTPRAIEFHSRGILLKLDAADKTTAVLKAVRYGLIAL